MNILNHELSSECESIITNILDQLTYTVHYSYVNEETSFSELINENYIVSISKNTTDFEGHLLHEMCHLLQFQEHYPMIKVKSDIWDEDKKLITDIQNIVLDLDVMQRLKVSA